MIAPQLVRGGLKGNRKCLRRIPEYNVQHQGILVPDSVVPPPIQSRSSRVLCDKIYLPRLDFSYIRRTGYSSGISERNKLQKSGDTIDPSHPTFVSGFVVAAVFSLVDGLFAPQSHTSELDNCAWWLFLYSIITRKYYLVLLDVHLVTKSSQCSWVLASLSIGGESRILL